MKHDIFSQLRKRAQPAPDLRSFLALSWLVTGLLSAAVFLIVCLLNFHRPWAIAALGLQLASLLVPLNLPPPAAVTRFLRFSVAGTRDYFPISVVYEDKDDFSENRPFMIGYEPHSVLPLGACVFLPHSQGMPPCLTNTHVAATSTVFLTPFMRHMVYWLGCRPASREVLRRSLEGSTSVLVCPGGVQECFYMEPEPKREVVFLRQRTGFVRLAMETGVPLVPVFAFGQTPHYRYWRPFIDWPRQLVPRGAMGSLVRRIGYVPMLVWGWLGTAMPHKVPLTVVVGKPIKVPHRASPSPEEVQRYLQQYIAALQGIFERYKAAAGHPLATLTVV